MGRPKAMDLANGEVVQTQTKDTQTPIERRYRGTEEIDHDLFKLNVSTMKKNHAMDGSEPQWIPHEHTHIYHSVDSSGITQEFSSSVGGHFHKIDVLKNEKGEILEVKVSEALQKRQQVNQYGRKQTVMVAIPEDNHTHTTTYYGSDKIKLRQINPEYVRFQSIIDSKKPGPVEGVR